MNPSSRRTLFKTAVASAAVIAVAPARALWAQPDGSDRVFESRLTGSTVELLNEDAEFFPEYYVFEEEADFIRETVSVTIPMTADAEIEFVQTTMTAEEYIEVILGRFRENWDQVEIADSNSGADGAWVAASILMEPSESYPNGIPFSVFIEYQAGAYEAADLAIAVVTRPDGVEEGISSVQDGILVGDLEPLMMVESSQVLALSFPVLTGDTSTTTSTSGRSSRSTRESGEEEGTTTDSSSRGQGQSGSTTSSDYPDAVREHRTEFMATFNEFAEALALTIEDSSTDAQVSGAFSTIDGLAEQWLGYPDRAAQLVASAEYSSLEGLYITWADEIATLGSNYLGLYDGTSDVDAMFNQIDVVDQADRALVAELDSL